AALYIHGGAWIAGDKTDYPAELIKSMAADAGIAAASMNYRLLFDGASCDHMIGDVYNAVALIKRQAAALGVTIDRLSITGVSAGAHLALLYSYTSSGSGDDSPIPVTLCVSLSGPADFTDPAWFGTSASLAEKRLLISTLTGQPFTESDLTAIQNSGVMSPDKREALERISPVYQIHSDIPPTLFAHGTQDAIVPFSNAERLDATLSRTAPDKNLGLTVFPHSGHGLDTPEDAQILAAFLATIKEELENR
ncbi:MAG: alpha/beta hydrolase, partial [Treponema sp.]|nr:alpha/beta hydrolase [Treponema sp.]